VHAVPNQQITNGIRVLGILDGHLNSFHPHCTLITGNSQAITGHKPRINANQWVVADFARAFFTQCENPRAVPQFVRPVEKSNAL
jgi:hypothetical protein